MSDLITIRPKIKQKGFNPDNIGISAFTKEDTAVYNRILRMTSTPYYNDLSSVHKKLVDKICKGYKRVLLINLYARYNCIWLDSIFHYIYL